MTSLSSSTSSSPPPFTSYELYQQYYQSYFPANELIDWQQSISSMTTWDQREWSARIPTKSSSSSSYSSSPSFDPLQSEKSDMIRYKSFSTGSTLKSFCLSTMPYRLETGPIYKESIQFKSNTSESKPIIIQRPLTFDIDMDEYDKGIQIRFCCFGTRGVCAQCWTLLVSAVGQLKYFIQHHFGFQQLLCVYSGRRGLHIWVTDPAAMKLSGECRKSIEVYIHTYFNGTSPSSLSPLEFDPLLFKQSELDFKDMAAYQSYSTRPTKQMLLFQHASSSTSLDYQKTILSHVKVRLDVGVTVKMNHLLKCPFSIHPSTSKICIVLEMETLAMFNPATCPTVDGLVAQQPEAIAAFQHSLDIFHQYIQCIRKTSTLDSSLQEKKKERKNIKDLNKVEREEPTQINKQQGKDHQQKQEERKIDENTTMCDDDDNNNDGEWR